MAKKKAEAKAQVSRDHIVLAVNELEKCVKEWEGSDEPELRVFFKGRTVSMISQSIEVAANALFELVDTDSISQDAYDITLAVDVFEEAIAAHAEKLIAGAANVDPSGGPEVWGPFAEVVARKTPRRKHKVEPIGQLIAEKVPRIQIAKMYGFILPDGNPDLERVQREVTSPGSEFDVAKFVAPVDRKHAEALAEKWQERKEARANRNDNSKDSPEREKREAPETLEELILQGINIEQILKMKDVTEDEVRETASDMGVALDSQTVIYGSYVEAQRHADKQKQAELQRQIGLSKLNSHPELGPNKDERIYSMHLDGVRPGMIAQALENDFPGISHRDVTVTIAKVKKARDPAEQDKLAHAGVAGTGGDDDVTNIDDI